MLPTACEYEKYFDEYEEDEYSACEDEDSFQTAPTSLPLGPPAPLEHELANPDKWDPRASVDSGVGSITSEMLSIKRSSTGGSSGDSGEGFYSIPDCPYSIPGLSLFYSVAVGVISVTASGSHKCITYDLVTCSWKAF